MNIPTELKQDSYREQTCVCQGIGGEVEGRIESLGLADANYYI